MKRGRTGSGGVRQRIWELDAARGIALILMAVYHGFYVAWFIGLSSLNPHDGFLGFSPILIAAAFLAISGASVRLSDIAAGMPTGRIALRRPLLRFLKTGSAALLVSLVTYLGVGWKNFVGFGILHCLALGGLIAWLLRRLRIMSLILGTAAVILGFAFFYHKAVPDSLWPLAFIGPRPVSWEPVDFVPLLPWAGFILAGLGVSGWLWSNGAEGVERRYAWPFHGDSPMARALAFLGRHSLLFYLVHIPLLFGIIWIASKVIAFLSMR